LMTNAPHLVNSEGMQFGLRSNFATQLGREPNNDIVVGDSTVSGHHATITPSNGKFYLRDANSSNGTYLNGRRVSDSALADGDVIQFGRIHFTFHGGGPAMPVRTADDTIARAERITAETTLRKEHTRLVAGLATGGTLVAIVINAILLAVADKIGGEAGGTFLILIGIVAAVLFVASLVPSKAERFNITNEKVIDPATGSPLRMLWWFRWMTAMIALWTFVGSSDYFGKHQTLALEAAATPVAASTVANEPPPPDQASLPDSTTTAEQKAFALRAFCGSLVGAATSATPDQDKKTIQTMAIVAADQVIAKKYNLTMDQANTILQLAFSEQEKRGGENRAVWDAVCNPL
jgi:hypothetical protein